MVEVNVVQQEHESDVIYWQTHYPVSVLASEGILYHTQAIAAASCCLIDFTFKALSRTRTATPGSNIECANETSAEAANGILETRFKNGFFNFSVPHELPRLRVCATKHD